VVQEIKEAVSHYLFTVACINAGLGTATAIAMWLLGMPDAVLWGVIGVLLAVPILVMVKIYFSHSEHLAPFAEVLGKN
jgi:predicted PurR-regulated permease PerM